MSRRKKAVVENRPCENCGLPLKNGRHVNARYCLREACRAEIGKRDNKKSIEKLKRLWNGSGY